MTATWRVVCEGGAVREVTVEGSAPTWGLWYAVRDDGEAFSAETPRLAVALLAADADWPVAEIVAPGELTRAEAVAAAVERCAATCDAAAARWGALAPGELVRADDRRERGNEAAALAAEIRGGAR